MKKPQKPIFLICIYNKKKEQFSTSQATKMKDGEVGRPTAWARSPAGVNPIPRWLRYLCPETFAGDLIVNSQATLMIYLLLSSLLSLPTNTFGPPKSYSSYREHSNIWPQKFIGFMSLVIWRDLVLWQGQEVRTGLKTKFSA